MAVIEIKEVVEMTGLSMKTVKLWSHDGRLPKFIKRKHSNEPYRWKRLDIENWLSPKPQITEERIREITRTELVRMLQSNFGKSVA